MILLKLNSSGHVTSLIEARQHPFSVSGQNSTWSSYYSRRLRLWPLPAHQPPGSPTELLVVSQISGCLWPLWTIHCSVPFPGKPFCNLQTLSWFTWLNISRWITSSRSSKSSDLQSQSHFLKQERKMWLPKFRLVSVIPIPLQNSIKSNKQMVWDNTENSKH